MCFEFTGFLSFKTLYNIELISVQATGGPSSGNLKLDEFFCLQDKRQDNALFGVLHSPMYIDFIQII